MSAPCPRYGLHQYPGNFQSNTDVTSLPLILSSAGWKTGIIGKFHVAPEANYAFDFGLGLGDSGAAAECWAGAADCTDNGFYVPYNGSSYNYLTRNLTHMRLTARRFLSDLEPDKPFLLYVGFGDVHRCAPATPFCETYGDADTPIPDWTPVIFDPDTVQVPSFLPDTPDVRFDLASLYTATNRLDTGIGLMVQELELAGALDNTLIIFFSDNGSPFPSGKTNLFTQQGMGDPLIIVSPDAQEHSRGLRTSTVVSSLDLLPTILDFTGVAFPTDATCAGLPARLLGRSLLELVHSSEAPKKLVEEDESTAFASHAFHSLYAYYPMRAGVGRVNGTLYRLVHNLNFNLDFAILEDVYVTSTWSALEADGEAGTNTTGWVYDYSTYMRRPEWQLFDVDADPLSLRNVAEDPLHAPALQAMQGRLLTWRRATNDPWLPCNNMTTAHECSI